MKKLKFTQKGRDIKSKTKSYQDFRLINSWTLLINYACFVFGVILIAIGLDKKIGFWIIISPMVLNWVFLIIFGIGRVSAKELAPKNLLILILVYALLIVVIGLGMLGVQIPKIGG